jgi:hypothetical protein
LERGAQLAFGKQGEVLPKMTVAGQPVIIASGGGHRVHGCRMTASNPASATQLYQLSFHVIQSQN